MGGKWIKITILVDCATIKEILVTIAFVMLVDHNCATINMSLVPLQGLQGSEKNSSGMSQVPSSTRRDHISSDLKYTNRSMFREEENSG